MKEEPTSRRLETEAVHGGERRPYPCSSLTVPIFQSATFVFEDFETYAAYSAHEQEHFEYARNVHPTQQWVERKLAALEGAEDALLFASGMAAITTSLLALLSQGDHMLVTNDAYKRTLYFCRNELPRFGIEATLVPVGDLEAIEAAIRPNTRWLLTECPTNPHLYVPDLPRLVERLHRHRVRVMVDSTFATPINLRPLEWGADLVLHSATKYLAGHNDVMAGVLLGSRRLVEEVREFHVNLGGIIDPHPTYLLVRGLKTLALRVQRQNETALELARRLEAHPAVERVFYPLLPSHPHYEVARRLLKGGGGVVSFELKGGLEAARRFFNALKICLLANSLGGVETLLTHPYTQVGQDQPPEELEALGITPGLIRLAVGIEHLEDLWADLEAGLRAALG